MGMNLKMKQLSEAKAVPKVENTRRPSAISNPCNGGNRSFT